MNQCVFIGRMVADPESRTTQSGVANATFRIAVQRRFKDAKGERQTDFISCVAWRGTAEFVTRFFRKGDMIAVTGSLQNRSYEAQDGTKRFVSEIIVENAEFCGGKREDVDQTVQKAQETFGDGYVEVTDDALPF